MALTDEEILFKLRNSPKNKWEDLAKEFNFNLKKYAKLLEEEERKKREEIELVSNLMDIRRITKVFESNREISLLCNDCFFRSL